MALGRGHVASGDCPFVVTKSDIVCAHIYYYIYIFSFNDHYHHRFLNDPLPFLSFFR